MVRASAFQADNAGSIPVIHSKYRQMFQGGELVSKTDCGGFDSLLSMPKKWRVKCSGLHLGLENQRFVNSNGDRHLSSSPKWGYDVIGSREGLKLPR